MPGPAFFANILVRFLVVESSIFREYTSIYQRKQVEREGIIYTHKMAMQAERIAIEMCHLVFYYARRVCFCLNSEFRYLCETPADKTQRPSAITSILYAIYIYIIYTQSPRISDYTRPFLRLSRLHTLDVSVSRARA